MDYQEIQNLFSKENKLKKYRHKRWVKIHPDNINYGENTAIRYNCKTIQDKLVSYHDGYLLLNVRISRAALLTAARVAPKNSSSFIRQSILRINNVEVENYNDVFLAMEMMNQLEFSQDFSRNAKQWMFSQDTSDDNTATNHGQSERILMLPAVANNRIDCSIKIPLIFVSNFFRSLDFPLINQLVEFELVYRLTNAILGDANDLVVAIRNSTIFLPIIELPLDDNEKLLKGLSSGKLKKSFTWDYLRNSRINGLTANSPSSNLLESTIDGVKKLYVLPRANFNFNQTSVDLHNTIKLKSINIVIDSEDFYPQDIQSDEEAYEIISENFNMGGKDANTGSLLDFKIFKNQNSFYVFDLSRQRVFSSDPRKSQSIRFTCKPTANCSLHCVLAQQKETTFDFVNPLNTKTN